MKEYYEFNTTNSINHQYTLTFKNGDKQWVSHTSR